MLFHWNQIQIQPVPLTHLVREKRLENRREKFLSMRTDDQDILDFGKLGPLGHAINTSDCKPVKQPACRVPQTNSEKLSISINSWKSYQLRAGLNSLKVLGTVQSYLLRTKQDGTYCMCTEHCKLNQLTKKDSIPRLRWMMCQGFRLGSGGFLALMWPPATGRCK